MKLSVVIITYNEEENIRECLESIEWANEIIIVDGFSEDETLNICREYTDKIYQRENVSNLNINKSYGFKKAMGEWILYLDADERVSIELAQEVREILSREDEFAAYKIPRKNYYFGYWLKHGGNFPDHQLRLFKRGKAYFKCQHVHERLQVEGKIAYLQNSLLHYTYPTISCYLKKFDFYTSFEAEYMLNTKKKYCMLIGMTIKPVIRFIRRYFFKLGFLDGFLGLMACIFDALGMIVSYGKYWEMKK
ncbi:MAG: glycosyltransferase family 2 protein [bacterium]|nr:glycosyltransferase family 2 protein [bacterium]